MEGDRPAEDLGAAADWLHAANRAGARRWALGEERRFEADQGRGRISLFFRDGKRVELPMQIIASFVPTDHSVRWAWANDSVAPDLAAAADWLRCYGEEQGVAVLVEPEPMVSFNELANFAALAARQAGCEGAYRCLRSDHSTVMLGFGPPEAFTKDDRPIDLDRLWHKSSPSPEFEARALSLVEAWDAAMLPIDRAFEERTKGRLGQGNLDVLDAALEEKDVVFDRYWVPKNDLWRPTNMSWPSDHDPHQHRPNFTVPRRGGGCFVVRSPRPYQSIAYVVEDKHGAARITDIDLNWGSGLLWIDPPEPPARAGGSWLSRLWR